MTLHEIEESPAGSASPSGEAPYWLERAETIVIQRQAELDELTGWMTRRDTAAAAQISSLVPSVSDCIRWAATVLERGADDVPDDVRAAIEAAKRSAEDVMDRAERLSGLADDLVEEIEFGFLFDPERQLFSIGYSVADGRLDGSYYDMLASEARLASFVGDRARARFRTSTGSSSDAR